MSIQKNDLTNKVFGIVERVVAIFCVTIPFILYVADDFTWRSSISNYVYMCNSYVFGLLLTIAAMLFIFNGALYFKSSEYKILEDRKKNKWYNILLGVFLLLVVLFPHEEYKWPHYFFAGGFFLGSSIAIALDSLKKDKRRNLCIAILSILSLVFYFINWKFNLKIDCYTLLIAEWLSLFVISIHYYMESKETISVMKNKMLF